MSYPEGEAVLASPPAASVLTPLGLDWGLVERWEEGLMPERHPSLRVTCCHGHRLELGGCARWVRSLLHTSICRKEIREGGTLSVLFINVCSPCLELCLAHTRQALMNAIVLGAAYNP
jgi:hypothetical protein